MNKQLILSRILTPKGVILTTSEIKGQKFMPRCVLNMSVTIVACTPIKEFKYNHRLLPSDCIKPLMPTGRLVAGISKFLIERRQM